VNVQEVINVDSLMKVMDLVLLVVIAMVADQMYAMPFREVNVIAVTPANLLMNPTEQQHQMVEQDGEVIVHLISQPVVPLQRVNVTVAVVADLVMAKIMHMPVFHLVATTVVVTETPKCAEHTKVVTAQEEVVADSAMAVLVKATSIVHQEVEVPLFVTNSKKATVIVEITADSLTLLMFAKNAVEMIHLIASVVYAMISKRVIAPEVIHAVSLMKIKLATHCPTFLYTTNSLF